MSHLKHVSSEELLDRWNQLFPKFLETVKNFKQNLDKLNLEKNELSIIREELKSRNIKVEEDV